MVVVGFREDLFICTYIFPPKLRTIWEIDAVFRQLKIRMPYLLLIKASLEIRAEYVICGPASALPLN